MTRAVNNGLVSSDSTLFTRVQTVEVTWDDHFSSDNTVPGLSNSSILHVPATDTIVVMAKTSPPTTPIPLPPLTESDNPNLDACPGGTLDYKEYTPDMQPTGRYGYLVCGIGDWNSMRIGDDIYVVKVWNNGPGTANFWRLFKFDAVTWEKLGTVDVPLEDSSQMRDDGPTLSYINGLITLSGDYWPNGNDVERGSHHHFVTTDLQLAGEKILKAPDVPFHCPMSSLRQLATGDILIFTGVHYFGPLKVMRLDKDWNFVDEHPLRGDASFPLGAVSYGGYWFVVYTDWREKPPGRFPVANVGLAAFDTGWNLVQDEELTDFDAAPEGVDQPQAESFALELRGDRLYVAYTVATFPPDGSPHNERVLVNVYELKQEPAPCTSFTITPTSASSTSGAGSQQVTVTGAPSGCTGGSWTASGNGSWLTVSPSSGSGSGSVTVSWEANTGTSQRTGTATIAGQTFTVTQAGSGGTSYTYSYWLPVISHASGAGGSQWRSDAGILNRASSSATVELRLHNGSSTLTSTRALAASAQEIYQDLAAQLGVTGGSGALEIRSTQPLLVTCRIYNLVSAGWTYGSGYDALPSSDGLATGETAWLPQLTQTGNAGEVGTTRTNIGITNTGTGLASVTLALHAADGSPLWSDTRSYGPGVFYQYQEPFKTGAGRNDIAKGYATITVNSGDGVIAYASVIDNASGDPTTVNMKR